MEPLKTLGQVGYEAYSAHTGGKSLVSGETLPAFDALGSEIQDAWNVAGQAVANEIDARDGEDADQKEAA